MEITSQKNKNASTQSVSQFELTTNIITKLNTFKLTPTAKLVLLYLTTCYNPKHKEVFPKQKTIADKLGISEASVIRAVSELHKEGLIISERKYTNRYILTSKIVSERPKKMTDNINQIEKENINLQPSYIEQKKETKKEPSGNFSNSIEFEGFKILRDYAIKHGAKNVNAYVNSLRKNGNADKIIKEYKTKQNAVKKALRSFEESQSLIKEYNAMKNNCCTAEECGLSLRQILHRTVASE